MSDNKLNKATRIIAYDTGPGATTAHGFRSTASTQRGGRVRRRCSGSPTRPRHGEKKRRRRGEVVRRQLGKGDKNKIRGIYNRAAYWKERVRLMQHWADRLDGLRAGAPAVALRGSAA